MIKRCYYHAMWGEKEITSRNAHKKRCLWQFALWNGINDKAEIYILSDKDYVTDEERGISGNLFQMT